MTCRDWMSTLWPASYKGVPFRVSVDRESGGRRLAIHTFPNRDVHFIEDLGSMPRRFSVDGYLGSDAADFEVKALLAVLDSDGPGTLVLPVLGPVTARAEEFDRGFDKDELGRIAIEIEFVIEGASTALVTATQAAQQAFDAIAGLGVAASAALGRWS